MPRHSNTPTTQAAADETGVNTVMFVTSATMVLGTTNVTTPVGIITDRIGPNFSSFNAASLRLSVVRDL